MHTAGSAVRKMEFSRTGTLKVLARSKSGRHQVKAEATPAQLQVAAYLQRVAGEWLFCGPRLVFACANMQGAAPPLLHGFGGIKQGRQGSLTGHRRSCGRRFPGLGPPK